MTGKGLKVFHKAIIEDGLKNERDMKTMERMGQHCADFGMRTKDHLTRAQLRITAVTQKIQESKMMNPLLICTRKGENEENQGINEGNLWDKEENNKYESH